MANVSSELLRKRRQTAFDMRGEEATYHKYSSKDLTLKTGQYKETFTESTIDRVLVGFVDLDMITESGGKYQTKDRVFRVLSADLPSGEPNKKSQIEYNSTMHRIIEHKQSADGNIYVLICREI